VLVMIITYSSFEEQLEREQARRRSNVNTMGKATVSSHSDVRELPHADTVLQYCSHGLTTAI
jgi:hypothetical protein